MCLGGIKGGTKEAEPKDAVAVIRAIEQSFLRIPSSIQNSHEDTSSQDVVVDDDVPSQKRSRFESLYQKKGDIYAVCMHWYLPTPQK